LFLLTGLHGSIKLANYNNLKDITIMAYKSHKPFLKKLEVTACRNWIFSGLIISSEPYGEYINNRLVYFESHNWQGPTTNIDIVNCDIFSSDKPWLKAEEWVKNVSDGIYVRCDSVNIINNTIRNIYFGIRAAGNHINAINNEIINFAGDGMRMQGSYNLFEHNLIKNSYKIDDNHDDGIQSFTTNGEIVDNNIIRSNTIINYEDPNQPLRGDLQGIGCFDGFYRHWRIENNLIIVNHWHGITLLGADSCIIVNNTVLDPSPDITPGGSWIMIDNHKDGRPSTNCIVANNVANSIDVKGLTTNNIILNSYTEYFDNFVDYTKNDFHLKKGSILIDNADKNYAPIQDIENNTRNIGLAPDIGAYEYISPDETDNPNHTDIKIYPNPAKVSITIENNSEDYSIKIFDSMGNLKLFNKSNTKTTNLNLKELGIGLFYIVIKNKLENTTIVKEIILSD